MKKRIALYCLSFALVAPLATAQVTIVSGTPGDAGTSPSTPVSPNLGGVLLNFDSLTPFTTYPTTAVDGVSISSPDGLEVLPFSDQSGPNYLYDTSAEGTADITISLSSPTTAIGVGIADSDGVDVTLEALGAGGIDLGTFSEFLNPNLPTNNPGNYYFILEDTVPGLDGLVLTQTDANPNFSGLAIDDVQVAPTPEPSSMLLLSTGLCGVAGFGFRRKRA
jgi:hypothetical protein